MIFKLQGTKGMGNTFQRIRQGMCKVVGWVNAPGTLRSVMNNPPNAVQGGITQIDVGRSHINFGAKNVGALLKLTGPHSCKQIQVFIDRPTPEGAILPSLG